MLLRSTPPIATWFLNQFGSAPENESAIGDLIEQYQRGKGSIWYWRQALVIVFGGALQRSSTGKKAVSSSSFPNLVLLGGTPVRCRYSHDDAVQVASSDRIALRIVRQPHASRDVSGTHGKPRASMGCQCSDGAPEYINAAPGRPTYRIIVASSSAKFAARMPHIVRRGGYGIYRDESPADLPEPARRQRLSHYRPDRVAFGSSSSADWGN